MEFMSTPCVEGCGRTATLCYARCSPCRLRRVVATHGLALTIPDDLEEAPALAAERNVHEAIGALGRARNALARAAGAPTKTLLQGDGTLVHTFGEG